LVLLDITNIHILGIQQDFTLVEWSVLDFVEKNLSLKSEFWLS